jgi:hypothetical protein
MRHQARLVGGGGAQDGTRVASSTCILTIRLFTPKRWDNIPLQDQARSHGPVFGEESWTGEEGTGALQ